MPLEHGAAAAEIPAALESGQFRLPQGEKFFLAVLGLFMMVAPASTDMYLPALADVRRELGATQSQVQLTLSYFFLGFAFGQLFWGTLSDHIGRRKPMVAGILLYIAGSAGCALASGTAALDACRILQAFGGCAMPVIAQAVVRDVYGRDKSARALSIMLLVSSIAPIAAPLFGGQVLRVGDWRAIFWVLAVFGIVSLLAVFTFPETSDKRRRSLLSWRGAAMNYLPLLRDPRYIGYVVAGGATFGASFTYITGIPFVYIEYFKLSPQVFGLLFGANVIGMSAMAMLNSRIVGRVGYDRQLRLGIRGCMLFSFILFSATCLAPPSLPLLAVCLFCFMSARGFVTSNAMAGALASHPERSGAASALAGSLQFGFGALAGTMLSWFNNGTPAPMVSAIAMFCLIALLTRRLLIGKRTAHQ